MSSPREIIVSAEQVEVAIREADSKGWLLVDRTIQADGLVRLQFSPRLTAQLQPMGKSYDPTQPQYIDPNVAWLELLGFFGFLGIGFLVAGRTNDGILRLVAFLGVLTMGWIVAVLLMVVVVGFCLIPVLMVIGFGVPIWSALELKQLIEAHNAEIYQVELQKRKSA